MKKKFQIFRDRAGYTLMELLVVLAILALLTALAVPFFTQIMDKSRNQVDDSNEKLVQTAVEVYYVTEGKYPESADFNALVTDLRNAGYLKNDEIKVQNKKNSFSYDALTGIVKLNKP